MIRVMIRVRVRVGVYLSIVSIWSNRRPRINGYTCVRVRVRVAVRVRAGGRCGLGLG